MPGEMLASQKSLYDRLLDFICQICVVTTGVFLVFLTVIFGWLVYGRYVLNSTPTWVEQVSLLLIVYIAFLGAAVGVHKNTHLGVSFFREISPPPIKRMFELATHLLLLGFGILMMIYSYKLMVFKWSTEIPLIHVPEGLRVVPIVLCGAFVSLFSVGHLIHFFKSEKESSDPTEY